MIFIGIRHFDYSQFSEWITGETRKDLLSAASCTVYKNRCITQSMEEVIHKMTKCQTVAKRSEWSENNLKLWNILTLFPKPLISRILSILHVMSLGNMVYHIFPILFECIYKKKRHNGKTIYYSFGFLYFNLQHHQASTVWNGRCPITWGFCFDMFCFLRIKNMEN